MTDQSLLFYEKFLAADSVRPFLNAAYRMYETECVERLLNLIDFTTEIARAVSQLAEKLVIEVREQEGEKRGIEELMWQYDLCTKEGILLMCLAEALLRVPDKETEN